MVETATIASPEVPPRDNRGGARAGRPAQSAFDLPLSVPLVLDVDGTLIKGDLLRKSLLAALRRNFLILLPSMKWLWRGRAALKHELARRCEINWDRVELHQDVLALAMQEKTAGRLIIIATSADRLLAEQLAARLRFVDEVMASDGERNLKGAVKAEALARRFPDGFIYAGDSKADLPVWQRAGAIVLVNASKSVSQAARALHRPTLELAGRVH